MSFLISVIKSTPFTCWGENYRQARRVTWLRQRSCTEINASLKPQSGNLTKESEPQAAVQMLLQSWPSQTNSVGGMTDVPIQQHAGWQLCALRHHTSIKFNCSWLFFSSINLLNNILATGIPHMSSAGCQSRRVTSLWEAHLRVWHPYKELSCHKKTRKQKKPHKTKHQKR